MKKILFIILSFSLSFNAYNQNLVLNPSFENNIGCPTKNKQIELVKEWWSPFGSPYYFHECNNYKTNYRIVLPPDEKPFNIIPIKPNTGKAYVGIYLSGVADKHRSDYIMSKLKLPLEKDSVYHISMYVRLADVWKYIDVIGFYFSKDKYKLSDRQLVDFYDNDYYTNRCSIQLNKDSIILLDNKTQKLNSRDKWTKIDGEYKAKGGEQYITIGNFHILSKGLYNNNILPKIVKEDFDYSWYMQTFYYIDDIFVAKKLLIILNTNNLQRKLKLVKKLL